MNDCINSRSLTNANRPLKRETNDFTLSFFSKASHELKSPLTAIQTSTEILESYNDRLSVEEKEKQFQTIYESISNLSELIDDVITFCKSASKSIISNFEKFDLINHSKKIIEETKNTFSKAPQINFYPGINELEITSDKKFVSRILSELLSNAIKFSPSSREVDVCISTSSGNAIIKVSDNGIGIPENETDKIFTPFFRALNAKDTAGTSLGLAIVQSLVKMLEGQISFKSNENSGTIFTVAIPVNGKIE